MWGCGPRENCQRAEGEPRQCTPVEQVAEIAGFEVRSSGHRYSSGNVNVSVYDGRLTDSARKGSSPRVEIGDDGFTLPGAYKGRVSDSVGRGLVKVVFCDYDRNSLSLLDGRAFTVAPQTHREDS